MPRIRTTSVKEISNTHRYCKYCKANWDKRGFDKHQTAYKIIWEIQCRKQNQQCQSVVKPSEEQTQAEEVNQNFAEVDGGVSDRGETLATPESDVLEGTY